MVPIAVELKKKGLSLRAIQAALENDPRFMGLVPRSQVTFHNWFKKYESAGNKWVEDVPSGWVPATAEDYNNSLSKFKENLFNHHLGYNDYTSHLMPEFANALASTPSVKKGKRFVEVTLPTGKVITVDHTVLKTVMRRDLESLGLHKLFDQVEMGNYRMRGYGAARGALIRGLSQAAGGIKPADEITTTPEFYQAVRAAEASALPEALSVKVNLPYKGDVEFKREDARRYLNGHEGFMAAARIGKKLEDHRAQLIQNGGMYGYRGVFTMQLYPRFAAAYANSPPTGSIHVDLPGVGHVAFPREDVEAALNLAEGVP
jgi:hypothetical protein